MKKSLKFKPNYLIIPLLIIIVALFGYYFTSGNMDWYEAELVKPNITPPSWVFPVAWNIIFVCTTVSALIFWNTFKRDNRFNVITGLFITNGILNILWSPLFFELKLFCLAFSEMILLEGTIIALIWLLWKRSRLASLLLVPYAAWIVIATEITYLVITLNM